MGKRLDRTVGEYELAMEKAKDVAELAALLGLPEERVLRSLRILADLGNVRAQELLRAWIPNVDYSAIELRILAAGPQVGDVYGNYVIAGNDIGRISVGTPTGRHKT